MHPHSAQTQTPYQTKACNSYYTFNSKSFLTCSLELLIKVWLSIERSHPEGTSSHPNSFNALLINSVCFNIFRSWHFNSFRSFLLVSMMPDNLEQSLIIDKSVALKALGCCTPIVDFSTVALAVYQVVAVGGA